MAGNMNIYILEARSKLIAKMKKINANKETFEKGLRLLEDIYREIPNADSETVVISVMRYLGAGNEEKEIWKDSGSTKWEDSEIFFPVIVKLASQNSTN
ncbi:MAG: hypothetical protein ACP5I2_02420 [Fervidicoccaceae archaeon]